MERLLLFDIDGTLVRSRDGHLPFNEALRKTFGCDGDIRTVVPDGNTDPLIVKDILAKMNVDIEIEENQWREFTANLRESYYQHFVQGTAGIRPLPGATELLRALAGNEDFTSSIVTGNFETTAQVKLKAAGLAHYLQRGAYGSDSEHRPDLPAIAKQRFEAMTGHHLHAEQCIVIGDTPRDLEAARRNQMKSVLVGTGRYPVEDLMYWEPDGCVSDLSDTEFVVAMLSRI
jgi:phosphoglycolate phosphatase-like HAD superfamily hydrolase